MTPGEELLSLLHRRIQERGRITFAGFMQAALYEPRLGRYCRPHPPMGPDGDYITSPEVDEAFGRILGRAVAELFGRLTPPGEGLPLSIIEMGPGRGTLCRDLLRGLSEEAPAIHRSVRYTLVESSEPLAQHQRSLLADEPSSEGRVEWKSWEELRGGAPISGCIIANEFLDALPVHLVEWRGGALREIYVKAGEEGALAEEAGDPSTPELGEYFRRLGITLDEGQRAEVNLQALAWARQAAGVLGRGYAVVIDYGHDAEELYSERHHAGTLLGYRNHRLVTDPLATPGEQDLTSHVDFTSVAAEAARAGFGASGRTTQRNLLVCMGLPAMIARLAQSEGPGEGGRIAKRFALHTLMSPAGMGATFKVLMLAKGAEVAGLRCLRDPFRGPVEAVESDVYYPPDARPGPASPEAPDSGISPTGPGPEHRGQDVPDDSASPSAQSLRSLMKGAGSPAEAIARMVKAIHRSSPLYDWTGVYLLEGEELVLAHEIGKPTPHRRIPLDKGICGAAAREGSTIIVDDVTADPRYLACTLETRSEIVVPLKGEGGRILGEIDIDSDRAAAFDQGDREALEVAAGILSEALGSFSGSGGTSEPFRPAARGAERRGEEKAP
jgi:SAM-dependent MidA family methyltransferase/putative methionine-R-sulfoxide reductase with GAF domain